MEIGFPHGFTPVQRRDWPLYSWQSDDSKTKPWTSARCNRLLRPLTSRILILRKDRARFPSGIQDSSSKAIEVAPKVTVESTSNQDDNSSSDAEWARPRKRIKRTYSGKTSSKNHKASKNKKNSKSLKELDHLAAGEISIPTPILNRARGQEFCRSPLLPHSLDHLNPTAGQNATRLAWLKEKSSRSKLADSLQSIRESIGESRCNTYEGIYNGLDNLLRDTASTTTSDSKKKGAKSLFSMCLRTIPLYIAEEEALASEAAVESGNKSALDSSNVTAEIYDELQLYSSSECGWEPLRCVVRSHGIHTITSAIEAGLFEEQFSQALMNLCISTGASEEGEMILSSILGSKIFPRPKTIYSRFSDDRTTRTLTLLRDVAAETKKTSYRYQYLTSLISNGKLPLDWIATKEFSLFWTDAIKSLSHDLPEVEASTFIETVLSILATRICCDENSDSCHSTDAGFCEAVKHTFSSLLVTLSAISILSIESERPENPGVLTRRSPIYTRTTSLLQSCWAGCEHLNVTTGRNVSLLLAANMVVGFAGRNSELGLTFTNRLLAELRRHGDRPRGHSTAYGSLAVFISQVARCCGKTAVDSGLKYLEALHHWLDELISTDTSCEGSIIYELLIDSAFAFAKQMPDRRHLDYAEALNKRFHGKVATNWESPYSNRSHHIRTGFRWEEGISEWIAATPAPVVEKRKHFENWVQDDGSEDESPFRYGPTLPRNERSRPTFQTQIELPSSPGVDELGTSCNSYSAQTSDSECITDTTPLRLLQRSARIRQLMAKTSDEGVNRSRKERARASQGREWQVFEEGSDDELSSSGRFQQGHALADITNAASLSRRSSQKGVRSSKGLKILGYQENSILEDSEDELCA